MYYSLIYGRFSDHLLDLEIYTPSFEIFSRKLRQADAGKSYSSVGDSSFSVVQAVTLTGVPSSP